MQKVSFGLFIVLYCRTGHFLHRHGYRVFSCRAGSFGFQDLADRERSHSPKSRRNCPAPPLAGCRMAVAAIPAVFNVSADLRPIAAMCKFLQKRASRFCVYMRPAASSLFVGVRFEKRLPSL